MLNWDVLLSAVGLGIVYAAAPGVVNTEALRRGVSRGARAALWVEVGSLVGDSCWAVLALAGVAVLSQAFAAQVVLGIVGGFFLLRMGWLALHESFVRHAPAESGVVASRGDFATGIVFGIANPFGLAFWSGLGGSVVSTGIQGASYVLFFVGFFVGATLWAFSISLVVHVGRRWVRPEMFRWVNLLCGLALGYFGIRTLWATLQLWLDQHGTALLPQGRFLWKPNFAGRTGLR